MANSPHEMFFRSQTARDIEECLFFAMGERPKKVKSNNQYTITSTGFNIEVKESRRIFVNGEFCRGLEEVKLVICEYLPDLL